jgi:hypothetical protein
MWPVQALAFSAMYTQALALHVLVPPVSPPPLPPVLPPPVLPPPPTAPHVVVAHRDAAAFGVHVERLVCACVHENTAPSNVTAAPLA